MTPLSMTSYASIGFGPWHLQIQSKKTSESMPYAGHYLAMSSRSRMCLKRWVLQFPFWVHSDTTISFHPHQVLCPHPSSTSPHSLDNISSAPSAGCVWRCVWRGDSGECYGSHSEFTLTQLFHFTLSGFVPPPFLNVTALTGYSSLSAPSAGSSFPASPLAPCCGQAPSVWGHHTAWQSCIYLV